MALFYKKLDYVRNLYAANFDLSTPYCKTDLTLHFKILYYN